MSVDGRSGVLSMSAFSVSISRRSSLLGPAAPRGAIVLLLWSSAGGRSAARLSGLDGASMRKKGQICIRVVPSVFFVQADKRGWSRRIFFRMCLLHTNSDFCIRRAHVTGKEERSSCCARWAAQHRRRPSAALELACCAAGTGPISIRSCPRPTACCMRCHARARSSALSIRERCGPRAAFRWYCRVMDCRS